MLKRRKNGAQTKAKALLLAASNYFFSSSTYASSPEKIIDNSVLYLQGGIARALGTLVIVTIGYQVFYKQRLSKDKFVYAAIGLGLIFGAAEIYAYITRG